MLQGSKDWTCSIFARDSRSLWRGHATDRRKAFVLGRTAPKLRVMSQPPGLAEKVSASPAAKFFLIGLLLLLLGIPLLSVHLLVWDRKTTAAKVQSDIVAGWGATQNLNGPYLVIPFNRRVVQTTQDNGKAIRSEGFERDALVLAPEQLTIDAQLAPERRKRSLFESIVYTATIDLGGRFVMPKSPALGLGAEPLEWQNAYILLAIDDSIGLGGHRPGLTLAGQKLEFEPANREVTLGGVSLLAGTDATTLPTAPMAFSSQLRIKGSNSFGVSALGKSMTVRLRSPWPSPSFNNGILPDTRSVSAQGFDSQWTISYLALNRPVVGLASGANPLVRSEAANNGSRAASESTSKYAPSLAARDHVSAGVSLINPVDLYGQVGRAIKYGFLFLGFTFLLFFLYDVVANCAVSSVAYALVGLGLVLFFVLLLAFAEYIGFTPAYGLASLACIGLISAYAKAVLTSWARAGVIAAALSLLYGFLYVLLQLDDYALLVGAVAMFAALAALMYATRHVDWRRRPAT
jgi:inner membrane protein